MFLTGPRIVKHALGEDVTASALGGVQIQQRNGVCGRFVADDDQLALALTREVLGYLPRNACEQPPRAPPRSPQPESRRTCGCRTGSGASMTSALLSPRWWTEAAS